MTALEFARKKHIIKKTRTDPAFKLRCLDLIYKYIDKDKLDDEMNKAGIKPDQPDTPKATPAKQEPPKKEQAENGDWGLDFLNADVRTLGQSEVKRIDLVKPSAKFRLARAGEEMCDAK